MRPVKANELNIENVILLTAEQAKGRYNLGLNNLRILAESIGAVVRVGASGGKILYHRKKLDDYFENHAE